MSRKQIVPIVFATDDGYAPYLGVALHSLIVHASVEKEYKVYILYTNLTKEHRRRLCAMCTENVTVECVDVQKETSIFQSFSGTTHLRVEATYRLLIAELFPEFDKILYLDCDIIILEDVALLYQMELGEKILGVGEIALAKEIKIHFQTVLGVNEETGFNSGVLLINTKKFKEEGIKEKCLNLFLEEWKEKEKKFIYQDQDVLNITCSGKTKQFSMCWNLEWCFYTVEEEKNTKPDLLTESSRQLYEKYKDNVKIVHFTSSEKAWERPDLHFADYFWKYARETVFYEEILMNVTVKKKPKFNTFPWTEISAGSVIVIYGAGQMGQSYLEQMAMTNYCHVAAICDQNAVNIKGSILPVIAKEELSFVHFDYIILAILNNDTKEAVRNDLIQIGIPQEKIK